MATFIAELVSWAAARLPEGQGWQINGLPSSTGIPVTVFIRTEYVNVGQPVALPGLLCAQARGDADDIDQAMLAFGQALNLLTPVISIAANAHVPESAYELIYDNSPDLTEHRFLQWFRPRARDPLERPRQQMILPLLTQEVLNKVLVNAEGARVHRACVQYQEAVGSWTTGNDLQSVMHLWMAAEALTKAYLRTECQSQGVDEPTLCEIWGIERKELDKEVRRRFIFHADDACYSETRKTSDGLEHMFDDFPNLQARAQGCRDCAASHVRSAVLELIGLNPADLVTLTSMPYVKPVSLESADRVVHATLFGGGDRLAKVGAAHPMLETWIQEIRSIQPKGDGYEIEISDTQKWALGPGVHARVTGVGTNLPATAVHLDVLKGDPTTSNHAVDKDQGQVETTDDDQEPN